MYRLKTKEGVASFYDAPFSYVLHHIKYLKHVKK